MAYDLTAQPTTSIGIFTNNLMLEVGKTYDLVPGNTDGSATADYMAGKEDKYTIISSLRGELTITNLDEQEKTVGGTFWYDAVNAEGSKVEIREGRFNVSYLERIWFNRW